MTAARPEDAQPSPPQASSEAVVAVMRGNRRRDSSPEMALRRCLHRTGLRYRVDWRIDTGGIWVRPDVVFTRRRVAVFVDGCYWHACPQHGRVPKTNKGYWAAKFRRNRERDERQTAALEEDGWQVVRIWEHVAPEDAAAAVLRALRRVGPGIGGVEPLSRPTAARTSCPGRPDAGRRPPCLGRPH